MIRFLVLHEDVLGILAHRMTKEINGIQRNRGQVISMNIFRDIPNLLTGVIFYSDTTSTTPTPTTPKKTLGAAVSKIKLPSLTTNTDTFRVISKDDEKQ